MGEDLLKLDKHDSLKLSIWGQYEPFVTAFALERIKPGMVVVDGGANIGYYTVQFARRVGEKGLVYAFEPAPENMLVLTENVEKNGHQNVRLCQYALSDKVGDLKLYLSSINAGDHRISKDDERRESVTIPGMALDDLPNLKMPDFIKLDIQGAEAVALSGMKRVLFKRPLSLLMEFWPYGLVQCGSDPAQLLQNLLDAGFRISELDGREKAVLPFDAERLLKDYTPENRLFTELYCEK